MNSKYINWGLSEGKPPLPNPYAMNPSEDLMAWGTDALNEQFGINSRLVKKNGLWTWASDPKMVDESRRRQTHEAVTHPAGSSVYDYLTDDWHSKRLRNAADYYGKTFNPDLAPLAASKTQGEAFNAGYDVLKLLKELS